MKGLIALIAVLLYCVFVFTFYHVAYEKLGGNKRIIYSIIRLIICLSVAAVIGIVAGELIRNS